MATVLTEDVKQSPSITIDRRDAPRVNNTNTDIELGIWLSSLRSFVRSGPSAFFTADSKDPGKEARVLHSALLRASMLTAMLLDPKAASKNAVDLRSLASVLREATFLSEGIVSKTGITNTEYNALRKLIGDKLAALESVSYLVSAADEAGARNLPAVLLKVVDASDLEPEQAELALVLPRFGRVLKYLEVVGGMLGRDEPLKPSILIFSRVNELIYELTNFINNRLERLGDAEAEMFASLDAASYTASMELKKVYAQELAGVSQLRPAPSIYARTETAYALLHDGFQLILGGFAKIVDPSADLLSVFPEFKIKRDRSIVLRRELDDLVNKVQAAETEPEDRKVEALNSAIREFMLEPVTFLFYKDTETIERFVEEITMTRSAKEVVPLLHRFGAYLDTLLGQVSLRAVLADQI
ncbi:MAG: hypothetical protein JO314_00240 [Acidobacteria bacterium]|nr:hypothetical protein [Acidobacteriota bacterium]